LSSFDKVLVSAGNDCLWDTTEDKEVSDWNGICSLVSEVRDYKYLEYVFVGIRK